MTCRMLICFWWSCVVLLWCLVLGRIQHWTHKQHSKTAQPKADKYHTSHFSLFSRHVLQLWNPVRRSADPWAFLSINTRSTHHFYLSTHDQHTIFIYQHMINTPFLSINTPFVLDPMLSHKVHTLRVVPSNTTVFIFHHRSGNHLAST